MDLDDATRWLRQQDLVEFLRRGQHQPDDWITVYERRRTLFENLILVCFLLGPRKVGGALLQPAWNREYVHSSKPRLVVVRRRRFLGSALMASLPAGRYRSAEYVSAELGTMARYDAPYGGPQRIQILGRYLRSFLERRQWTLVFGIDSSRFSERTLAELRLPDAAREYSTDQSVFSLATRPNDRIWADDRDRFSSFSRLLGRKRISEKVTSEH